MKNVYLRKGGYYYAKMINGNRQWIKLHTHDYVEALEKVVSIQTNPLNTPGRTLKYDITKFMEYKSNRNLYSRGSCYNKANVLNQFVSFLPDRATTQSITPQQVDRWYLSLKQRGLSESTSVSYLMAVRAFFAWASDIARLRLDNPTHKIDWFIPKTKSHKPWVRKDDKNKLITNAPNKDLKYILFAGFDAGLRKEEIIEARCDWFDLDLGLLNVRKSTGNRLREGETPFFIKDRDERTIPLTNDFREFLSDYLKGLEPLDFALQPYVKHFQWRYRYDFRRPFSNYMSSQGMKWVTAHTMRHSFASILASQGVSLFKIATWLGDDIRVVQSTYAHLEPKDNDINKLISNAV